MELSPQTNKNLKLSVALTPTDAHKMVEEKEEGQIIKATQLKYFLLAETIGNQMTSLTKLLCQAIESIS